MNVTEICNLALSYIGKGRINSLDDDSEEAKKCRVHYDHERRRALLLYPWGFAKRIEKLALLDRTVPGWTYAYGYPTESIRVQYVFDEAGARKKEEERAEYEIVTLGQGLRVIATDVALAYGEYIADVKDTSFFSETFIEALSHFLASSIAMGITGSANIVAQQMQLAQGAIEQAKYHAAIERERTTKYPEKYQNARFS